MFDDGTYFRRSEEKAIFPAELSNNDCDAAVYNMDDCVATRNGRNIFMRIRRQINAAL